MAIPIPLLLAVLVAAWAQAIPWEKGESARFPLLGSLAAVLSCAALCAAAARALRRRLPDVSDPDGDPEPFARLYVRLRLLTALLAVAGSAFALGGARLGPWLREGLAGPLPGVARDFLALLPYALCALARRRAFGGLERELTSTPAELARDLRGSLIVLAPFALLLALRDLAGALPGLSRLADHFPLLAWAGVLLAAGSVLVLSPLLLRLAWPTRPLPAGPLRDRLESLAGRVGLVRPELRLWDVPSPRLLNAAVTGLLPSFRTVLLTVPLVRELSPEEVSAVFAHEASHSRRRHLVVYAGLGVAFLLWAGAVLDWTAGPAGEETASTWPALGALVAGFWFGLFGWLSRRFEREADLDGAEGAGDAETMARALERVASIGGIPRERFSWRHGSIAARVTAVRASGLDPAVRARHARAARIGKLAVPALAVAGLVAAAPALVAETRAGLGVRALDAGSFEVAEGHFSAALRVAPASPLLLLNRAAARLALGRPDEALDDLRRGRPAAADAGWGRSFERAAEEVLRGTASSNMPPPEAP
ncbi:MAG: M48 family metalloprotease [Planctomycetales bacterium]|nr:M48 family metalloprotease [Planctomycetales bacterium]